MDLNAVRIAWAQPYARGYTVQFWTGVGMSLSMMEPPKVFGKHFRLALLQTVKAAPSTLKLVSWKIPVRYIRIWMTESSNTCDTHGEIR